jgi:putative ABC transport system ATP-binding protein
VDIVEIYHLKKYFWEGVRQIKALDGIDLAIEKGRLTAITGASGSGKTTLLNTIGGLYRPTQGEVWVDGINLGELSEEQLTVFRRRKVGFVFQDYNLIPELTVRENILFPLALDGLRTDEVFFREIVGLLGLEPRLGAYSYELSGGERQCAAIARALITRPSIILADEPTGSLDVRSGQNVAGVLKMAVEVFRQTVVMVTHNLEAAQVAERVVGMKDGRVDD